MDYMSQFLFKRKTQRHVKKTDIFKKYTAICDFYFMFACYTSIAFVMRKTKLLIKPLLILM